MDYGIDLRYKSLHILTLLSLKLAKSAMIRARSDLDSNKKVETRLNFQRPRGVRLGVMK